MAKENKTSDCLLCGETATQIYHNLLGYQEGQVFDIYACESCGTSYALPMKSDVTVVNQFIYQNAEFVPGYNRYYQFAKTIAQKEGQDALDYLAKNEALYWPIFNIMSSTFKEARALEIGCGFGYLTYALNQFGIKTLGIDVAESPVNQAKELFGNNYKQVDLERETLPQKYDYIIATDAIAQSEDPVRFLANAAKLLKPGGKLLITTPNKDYAPLSDFVWATEQPPVHLWWFSENSMTYMADKLNLDVMFYNYSSWNFYKFPKDLLKKPQPQVPSQNILNNAGAPINPKIAKDRNYGLIKRMQSAWRYQTNKSKVDTTRSVTMFAIFTLQES